jgi:hypothetical protein
VIHEKHRPVSRAQFNAAYMDLLSNYVSSAPSSVASSSSSVRSIASAGSSQFGEARDALLQLVNRPRARCIDFRAKTNNGRGTTVLHEGQCCLFLLQGSSVRQRMLICYCYSYQLLDDETRSCSRLVSLKEPICSHVMGIAN